MVNLTPRQIIAIGAAIIFGPPIVLGLVLGYFVDWFAGIGGGMLLFLVIFAIAQTEICKRLRGVKDPQDEDKHEPD